VIVVYNKLLSLRLGFEGCELVSIQAQRGIPVLRQKTEL